MGGGGRGHRERQAAKGPATATGRASYSKQGVESTVFGLRKLSLEDVSQKHARGGSGGPASGDLEG